MPEPTISELRSRSAALGHPYRSLCAKCSEFGVTALDLMELDAYLHEALITTRTLRTVFAHALWELEEFGWDG